MSSMVAACSQGPWAPGVIVTAGVPIDSFNIPHPSLSLHVAAGINGDRLSGDGPALVARQEQCQVGHVLCRRDIAERHALEEASPMVLDVDTLLVGTPFDPGLPQLGVDALRH